MLRVRQVRAMKVFDYQMIGIQKRVVRVMDRVWETEERAEVCAVRLKGCDLTKGI